MKSKQITRARMRATKRRIGEEFDKWLLSPETAAEVAEKGHCTWPVPKRHDTFAAFWREYLRSK